MRSKYHSMIKTKFMRLAILTFLVFVANVSNAQLHSVDGGMSAYRKIKTIDYGTAHTVAYYKVWFLKDSTLTNKYSEAQTILHIGDSHLCYGDYYQQVADSLEMAMGQNRKNVTAENSHLWEQAAHMMAFNTKLVTDLGNQTIRAQLYTGLKDYEYTAAQPVLDWQLLTGDSLVNNVACKRATCHYAGRTYIAWYAESIPLPYGPYIFQGLPGLIMDIRDTHNNWIFTNNGVRKAVSTDVLYQYKRGFVSGDVTVTTREKVLSALRNETENRNNLLLEIAGVQVLKDGKWVKPEADNSRTPSNLIELEW